MYLNGIKIEEFRVNNRKMLLSDGRINVLNIMRRDKCRKLRHFRFLVFNFFGILLDLLKKWAKLTTKRWNTWSFLDFKIGKFRAASPSGIRRKKNREPLKNGLFEYYYSKNWIFFRLGNFIYICFGIYIYFFLLFW